MPDTSPDLLNIPGSPNDREFLYAVLNLPTTASDNEIRERYKQLSVVFHPDKQHDGQAKDTATKRFLEVQKAYEVLSDPITRRAYDLLGPDGLKDVQLADLSGLSKEELDAALIHNNIEVERARLEPIVRPRAHISLNVDASSLFEDDDYFNAKDEPLHGRLTRRLKEVQRSNLTFRHTVQKEINDKTVLVLSSSGGGTSRGKIMGTIRHQYSPRWNFEATTSLLNMASLGLKTTYRDDDSTVMVQTHLPALFRRFFSSLPEDRRLPPFTVALSRRLFPESPTQGTIVVTTRSPMPVVSVNLSSAHFFDHTPEASIPMPNLGSEHGVRPPSVHGLALGTTFWNVGVTMAGLMTGVSAQWGLNFVELGLQAKVIAQFALNGWSWLVGCEWRKNDSAAGASVGMGLEGIVLKLDVFYLGQQLTVPITLSHDRELGLALWTTVVPSTALVAAYYFILRPRRRRQRMEFFRRARRDLRDEKSDVLREIKETSHLLQDTAKKHMQAEASCGGLIIVEALYGPSERDESTKGLDVDVTVPVQALVNKSQLYIPGRRSKAGLQGFYDPAAMVAKTLRIRYTFRGRLHYAEFTDHMPVVLPLEEHLVD
ncbi:DnaJ-domain-containing protein [Sparassis latifolia]|uniref:DnaJ-domain-containing protein n=1 Tax=Sparassis crispa TaxID=139825 RepID=A0A401GZ17_9APHY|nr:DnaJ-domain-containing protein [Sparassis crispa]GBE87408.1 DnaJ-domain-containing protein [Sparassis crispa]